MAVRHSSALKNSCIVMPRRPNSKLAATLDERTVQDAKNTENTTKLSQSYVDVPKVTKVKLASAPKEFQQSDQDGEDFYTQLSNLKQQQRQTLQQLEHLYNKKLNEYYGKDINQTGNDIKNELLDSRQPVSNSAKYEWTRYIDDYSNQQENPTSTEDVIYSQHVAISRSQLNQSQPDKLYEIRSDSEDNIDNDQEIYDDLNIHDGRYEPSGYQDNIGEDHDEMHLTDSLQMVKNMWDKFHIKNYTTSLSSPTQLNKSHKRKSENKQQRKVTVPKPFSMTIREESKPKVKTTAQQELEEKRLQQRIMEEIECRKQFQSTPIPATTFLPLYQSMKKKSDLKSKHRREKYKERLKSMQKPFSFTNQDKPIEQRHRTMSLPDAMSLDETNNGKSFKAKPVPKYIFDNAIDDKIREQEEYRRICMRMRSDELLHQSKLPPSMQARNQHAKTKYNKNQNTEPFVTQQHRFHPQINHTVPDFDYLQSQFQRQLRKKKQNFYSTVTEPFTLRTAFIDRRQRSEPTETQDLKSPRPAKKDLSQSTDNFVPIRMTGSARLKEQKVRQSLDEQALKERKEMENTLHRKQREKNLKSVISKKVSKADRSKELEYQSKEKIRSYRESDRLRLEEYDRNISEMKNRVENRPFLFERVAQISAKNAAEKNFTKKLQDVGLTEAMLSEMSKRQSGGKSQNSIMKSTITDSDDDDRFDNLISNIPNADHTDTDLAPFDTSNNIDEEISDNQYANSSIPEDIDSDTGNYSQN